MNGKDGETKNTDYGLSFASEPIPQPVSRDATPSAFALGVASRLTGSDHDLQIPRLLRAVPSRDDLPGLLHELDGHERADHPGDAQADHQQVELVLLLRFGFGGDRRRVGGRTASPGTSARRRGGGEGQGEGHGDDRGDEQTIHETAPLCG